MRVFWRTMSYLSAMVLLLGMGAAPGLRAQTPETTLTSMTMQGTIGPYRVGVNYTVRDNTEMVAAHYFYVSQGKDIALTGWRGMAGWSGRGRMGRRST